MYGFVRQRNLLRVRPLDYTAGAFGCNTEDTQMAIADFSERLDLRTVLMHLQKRRVTRF